MAGLFSQIFDSADSASLDADVLPDIGLGSNEGSAGAPDSGNGEYAAQARDGDAAGGGSSHGSSGENSIGANFDINPTVSLHTELGGSVETLDGTMHSWSNTQDITATADIGAVLGASSDYAVDSFES